MRNSANRYPIAILLALSTALLALLIPGGPIETRTFPHIDLYILILFNLFLTLLGIASAITSYFMLILSFRSAIARRRYNLINRRPRPPFANRDDLLATSIAYVAIALGFLGTGIVIFATQAAIGS